MANSQERGARGFDYYVTKDQAMVDDADYGLMLWDGESKGTLNNVVKMAALRRPVVVYLAPQKAFHDVRSAADVPAPLARCSRASVGRLEREPELESAARKAVVS